MGMISAKQRHQLKKLIKDLNSHRANHTELVSVYIPKDYDMNKIINHLQDEQSTAQNIKSPSTRKNVKDALERMIRHLRVVDRTPENGYAVFSGNVAAREGDSDVRVWGVEPPVPLKTRIYKCDKDFVTDILEDMLETKSVYGLIVMDRRDADLALLKGKTIVPLTSTHSHVPGKFKAGGQCLAEDTLIQSGGGEILKIKSSHNPYVLKSMSKDGFSMVDSPIVDKWEVNKSQVYKIVTEYPRLELESSKDHVFFVRTDEGVKEKAAEELKEGDYLIMPEKIDVKGKVQKLNSKKYYDSFVISKRGQDLLKQRRLEKGFHQKDLAKRVGVTQTTISFYELGKLNASRKSLKKICKDLGINFKNFIDGYTKQKHDQDTEVNLPEQVNEGFAQFLGYIVGNGNISVDRILLFEQSKEVALAYKDKFDEFFNLSASYRFRKDKNYHRLRFVSRPLVRLIKNEFPEIKKDVNTLIPKKILKSPNKVLASFLLGFFDADGYVSVRKQVAFGTNNKDLAHQIQMSLLRFGIISSLHVYDNKVNEYSNNKRFIIDITEKKSLELFKKYIGLTCTNKSKKLENSIDNKTNKSNVRQIIAPGKEVRKIIEERGYNLEASTKVNSFFRNERMMSKDVFKNSILANVDDKDLYDKLEEVCNYPFLPVKISKIEVEDRVSDMVDISVKGRSFIANGLVVHNSAQRFARIREGAAKDHYKKVGDYMKKQFLNQKYLKGILVGGPGQTKNTFVEGGFISEPLKEKIIGIKDLSYTGEFGLQELVDKCQDVLAKEEIVEEKKIMKKFFEVLAKEPDKVSYGEKEVEKATDLGAVDKLLLSEEVEDEVIDRLSEKAESMGSEIVFISTDTREGKQLKDMGGIAAILRFPLPTV